MKLLAIIEAYSITGPAKNLIEFAELAREFDVDTSIATFVRGPESNKFSNTFIETARAKGIAVHVLRERGLGDRAVLKGLNELVSQERPQIVQTHAVKSHFLARLAGLPKRAPWIAFHHGYTWPAFRARVYNQLDRWSLRAAVKVVTVSIPFRDELVSKGVARNRIDIVHNAIRPDWGRGEPGNLREKLGIAPEEKVILIVGRLSREKDHSTLLRAVEKLPATVNPRLLIVGDGPERARIEQETRQLGLTASITLTGHQPSAEPYYRIANLAVLSSLSEGSPNALLEAMAAGVPVVATNVGGIPEIVTNQENALLVAPGDVDSMSTAMTRLLMDTALAMRFVENAHAAIREKHSPAARLKRLVEIYRSVL
jgi:glycosyltransferase involved in cell wall biosynthesis